MNKKYYATLSIGEFKCRFIIASINNKNLYLVCNEEINNAGIENFRIKNLELFKEKLRALHSKIKEKLNLNTCLSVILPACDLNVYKKSATISVNNTNRIITENDIIAVSSSCARHNLNENQEVIELIPLYYGLFNTSNYLYPPIGLTSTTLSLTSYAITMPKQVAHEYVKAIEESGFVIHNLISESSASSYYFKSLLQENNYLIIDIGYQTSKISLIIDEKVAAIKSLNFGSNFITNEIKSQLSIDRSLSEELKIKFADPFETSEEAICKIEEIFIYNHQLNTIINSCLEEMATNYKNIINELISDKILPVYLIGGGAELINLKEKFQSVMELPTSTIRPSIIGARKYHYIPLLGASLAAYEKDLEVENIQVDVKQEHSENFDTVGHFLKILSGQD